ncbi:MAG: glycosyltransferase [Verrucomicrobia bacterium]|nr:glycosyltransferase [Verrucomicrobiota bacterium]MCH8526395.1 glycosyltransferase [Kiritimatiellia bacterium]
MKILIVNSFDRDGGAARSARRLHHGLRRIGVESNMLVQTQTGDDAHTLLADDFLHRHLEPRLPLLDALPLALYPKRDVSHWANAWFPTSLNRHIQDINPDIIHLHWICRGLVSLADLRRWNRPVVWTLHDPWPFTGGCHYPPLGCTRFRDACGNCPALGSTREHDLSRLNWSRKKRLWKDLNLHVIGPSRWLTEQAQSSSLFRDVPCQALPNGIDTALYAPGDRAAARAHFKLPPDKPLILVVAMNTSSDKNKGGALALEALRLAAEQLGPDAAELVIAGESDGPDKPKTTWRTHRMGVITEEADMARLYQAADLQLIPSYQENLCNAIMEASACALPCVAFRTGGNGDMILHRQNGWLAEPFEPAGLTEGILHLLQHPEQRQAWGRAAREHILHFSELESIARRHRDLYQSILEATP